MNTQADYDLMKALFDKVKDQRLDYPRLTNWRKAMRMVQARLFTINLNLRPLLSYQELPQEIIDKIHHEALMTELREKLPHFRRGEQPGNCELRAYRMWGYHAPYVPNFWMDLFKQISGYSRGRRTVEVNNTPVNKKQYFLDVLEMNGMAWASKKNTVKQLIKELVQI